MDASLVGKQLLYSAAAGNTILFTSGAVGGGGGGDKEAKQTFLWHTVS